MKMSISKCGVLNPNYGKQHTKETRIKMSLAQSGKNHPNWQGGVSFEPYCTIFSDEEYKQSLRDRDGNICLNCNKTEDQEGRKLSLHHIDYDKMNCKPKNLVTVCISCNTKANTDREWHTEWYQRIMNKRYGYIYED